MTQSPKLRCGWFFILLVFVIFTFQVCCAADKSPFALTAKSVGKINGPADVGYIDEDYEWGFANMGFMLNGHGLPDHRRTFVIMHKSADGKTELIWPVFVYGDDQANAELLDHTLVFTAMLPDRSQVLMAHRVGEPPLVITESVLRLAAKRLGTNVIVPHTDYCFTKVRQPPNRIWLKGQPLASGHRFPPAGVFTLELTVDDLRNVITETQQRGKLLHATNFNYFSEAASTRLTLQDAEEVQAAAKPALAPSAVPVIQKTTQYRPRNEDLYGDVLLDAANQNAYFSAHHEPGRILKVALGHDPQTPPSVVGVAVLEGDEDKPFYGLIDDQNGYAYYGTHFPGHLVKVALGSSNTPPYRVGSVLIDENNNVGAGVLDSLSGYGCFQVGHRLVKIRLGKGDAPPAIVSQVEFPKEIISTYLESGLLDPTTHFAYFGSDVNKIFKVAFGNGDAPPTFVGSLTFQPGESFREGVCIDPLNGLAWFSSRDGVVIKVSLGETNAPPRRIGTLKLGAKYQYLEHAFGKDNAGYAYLGTMGGGKTGDPECCLGGVMKVALGKGEELPKAVSFMPLPDAWNITGGVVDAKNRILYLGVTVPAAGCKVLKLSLGEGNAPPKILTSTPLYPK